MSITLNGPYSMSISSDGTVTVTGPIQFTIKFCTLLGTITCVYAAENNTITGTASNIDNSITFNKQKFIKISGPSSCPAVLYLSLKVGPLRDSAGALVFVN
jgi:hypothetical protein